MHGALRDHLGSRQVARVIYGSIIGLALIAALEKHPPSPAIVAGSLVVTALGVALAEFYSEAVGIHTRKRRRVRRDEFREIAGESFAVAAGVTFPAVFFVLASAGVMETDTAFTLALWSGVGLIAFYGFWAGRLAGDGVARSLVQALGVGLIGVLLIGLKSLLH